MPHSIRRVVLVGALSTLAIPALASAQQFEGVISLRMTGSGPQANKPTDAEYYASRNGKARVELMTPMGKAAMIMAPGEGKMYMVLEQTSQYVEQDLPNIADAAPSTTTAALPKLVRTGKKETIAGYECEHIDIDGLDVCATSGLGLYLNVGGNIMARGGLQPWQKAVVKAQLFPLKVTLPDGTVQLLVTKIEKKGVDPAMFRVPATFTRVALPGRGS